MRNNDWYLRDEEDDFGEALHRRTEELYSVPDAAPDEDGLIECPVLPMRDMVVFPRMVSPVFLSQETSIQAVEEAHHRTVMGFVVSSEPRTGVSPTAGQLSECRLL